jgi:uncharacterized protein YecT (DUF1311 family)
LEEISMRVVFAALFALAAFTARAAEPPSKEDMAAVKVCTDYVAEKASKSGPAKDELDEKRGPEGRLAAASEKAGQDRTSCIGVLSTVCLQKLGDASSNGALNQCYSREAAVWDWRLNAAYRTVLAKMDQDAADNLRKTQRAWIAWREAMCAQPYATFKGTMAGPMQGWCELDLAGRQAIWIEGWISAVEQ